MAAMFGSLKPDAVDVLVTFVDESMHASHMHGCMHDLTRVLYESGLFATLVKQC